MLKNDKKRTEIFSQTEKKTKINLRFNQKFLLKHTFFLAIYFKILYQLKYCKL